MGIADDEDDDKEKEGDAKGTREWGRTTIEFLFDSIKVFLTISCSIH